MPLSKKDYKAIADIFKDIRKTIKGFDSERFINLILDTIVTRLSLYFKLENELFKKDKFYKACKLDNGDKNE